LYGRNSHHRKVDGADQLFHLIEFYFKDRMPPPEQKGILATILGQNATYSKIIIFEALYYSNILSDRSDRLLFTGFQSSQVGLNERKIARLRKAMVLCFNPLQLAIL